MPTRWKAVAIAPQIITTEAPNFYELSRHPFWTRTEPQKPVAWDTETTSLEPRDAKFKCGIGLLAGATV